MKAVVLLSGGLDSATALALALSENDSVIAVGAYYGAKHADAEITAAQDLVAWYKENGHDLKYFFYELPDVFKGASSALMDEVEMPKLTYREIAEGVGPSPTVVPFRNANLLSLATSVAVTNDAQWVYAGMHAEDARGFAYPDCTPEFLGPFAAAIFVGTYHKVRLKVPFQWMMKKDIVVLAHVLGVPVNLTWSCYAPVVVDETEPSSIEGHLERRIACGKCPTCVERVEAFQVNGWVDPIEYANDEEIDWEDCVPFNDDAT
jgi:7-cyano-7-deazaguanine synthase